MSPALRAGPARADPVPAGRANHDRAPRCVGLPARHQRATRVGGRHGADRGLPRDAAWAPGAAPRRQGRQAGDHAADRAGPTRPRGVPRTADREPLVLRPTSSKPIDRRDVYRMVLRIANLAGIPRHVSPQSLRHAAITNALDAGIPLRDTGSWPGTPTHAPPSTTTEPAATSTPRRPRPHRLRRRSNQRPSQKDGTRAPLGEAEAGTTRQHTGGRCSFESICDLNAVVTKVDDASIQPIPSTVLGVSDQRSWP